MLEKLVQEELKHGKEEAQLFLVALAEKRGWYAYTKSFSTRQTTLGARKATVGQKVEARVMQDVSLSSLMRVRVAPSWLDTSSSRVNPLDSLQSWLEVLTQDSRLVLVAAGQAQKAADLVLNQPPSTSGA
jgi:antirestriction protein ArdC